jgi:hypothetical protein
MTKRILRFTRVWAFATLAIALFVAMVSTATFAADPAGRAPAALQTGPYTKVAWVYYSTYRIGNSHEQYPHGVV